jgi:hypothetical protein
MFGKNSTFSPSCAVAMIFGLLLLVLFVVFPTVDAQTGTSGSIIVKLNNTDPNDPLRNAILTFSDGTTIFDVDKTSDFSTDLGSATNTDLTDSSNQATSFDSDSDTDTDTDSSDNTQTRTTSLDSNDTGPTGQIGTSTGQVGTSTGEVGTSTGEVGTSTGEVRSPDGEVGS